MIGLLTVVTAWLLVARDILSMPLVERWAWYVILAVLMVALMSLNWETQKTTWLLFAMALAHARHARPGPHLAAAGDARRGHQLDLRFEGG